jgi:hypothetical protein
MQVGTNTPRCRLGQKDSSLRRWTSLSRIFDGRGDDARAVNSVPRRWLLRFLE